jgi:pimeloyl-ACP methyl ester carboxylesterase
MTRIEKISTVRRQIVGSAAAAVAASIGVLLPGVAPKAAPSTPGRSSAGRDERVVIDFVRISEGITLRRMVVRAAEPKGTVLFLHGFPETLYAWKDIAAVLGADYDVHAFDWPGYGLSSRPLVDTFSYAPKEYADVLRRYLDQAGIDRSTLAIYATDIGSLPALLLAVEDPGVARTIIVGDFAPLNRPQHMYESLQRLKAGPGMQEARIQFNRSREDILENAFTRGLPAASRYEISREFRNDMARGWDQGTMTTADAFSHYYAHFTRDQDHFEAQLERLKTSVRVVWGEQDLYIRKEMGIEFAAKIQATLTLLPGIGHYPHLQSPQHVLDEVHASFR